MNLIRKYLFNCHINASTWFFISINRINITTFLGLVTENYIKPTKFFFIITDKPMNKIPAYQTLNHKKWTYKHKWILKSSNGNLKHADHNTFKRRLTLCTQIYLWDEEVCALQKNQKCLSNHNKQMDWQHIVGIMIKRTIHGVVFLLFPCHSTIRC